MTIRYISTRGGAPELTFQDVVLAGLAPDGGLYVPSEMPAFSLAEIAGMQTMSYPELAYAIISRFTGGSIAPDALESMINQSYKDFRHAAVAPIKQLDGHTFLLELFHGPTLAFKDFALQFLGRLLDHILEARGQRAVVVGATSGDTGSAAIMACQGRRNMDVFILHPKDRVSDVQRRQMTTVPDDNIHNLAIEGNFDDCQDIVKALFADTAFAGRHHLTAVNSINWVRIMAQIVYYFYASLTLGGPARSLSFTVPTGNFGDIYAGYLARAMGLPIDQLIIATNSNDILARTLATGTYGMEGVTPTLSPSMDIQISSNFERLLFDLHERDGKAVTDIMARLRKDRSFTLGKIAWNRLRNEFSAASVNDEDTKAAIKTIYEATGELLDPHTAVGLTAGQRKRKDAGAALVVLATAHPSKFPEAVEAACGVRPALPPHLARLMEMPERFDVRANDATAVKRFIDEHCTHDVAA